MDVCILVHGTIIQIPNLKKKIVCIIMLYFVKVQQIQVCKYIVYFWPSVQFHLYKACIICITYLLLYFFILSLCILCCIILYIV